MPQSFLDSLPVAVRDSAVFYIDADDISGVSNGAAITSVNEFISGVSSSSVDAVYASTTSIGRPAIEFDGVTDFVDNTQNSIKFADTSIAALDAALKSTELTICSVVIPRADDNFANIFEYNSKIRLKHSAREVGTTLPTNDLRFPGTGQNNLSTQIVSFSNNYGTNPSYSGGTLSEMCLNGSLVKNRESRYVPNANNRDIFIGSNQGVIEGLNGYLFKFLIFDRELTPQEKIQLDAAIQINLGQPERDAGATEILVFDGNSIPNGITSNIGENEDGFTYVTAQTLGLQLGQWHNLCRSGSNIQEANVSYSHRLGWLESYYEKPIVVVANYWFNEDATGSDYASVSRSYMALATLNTHFIWGTPPHGNFDAAQEARRQQDITDILANSGTADLIWNLHLNTDIGVGTSYSTDPSFWGDGIHLSSTGQAVMSTDVIPVINSFSAPSYIGIPVITAGQSYRINEESSVSTRLNDVNTGVPSQISWTGGGNASSYTISDSNYSIDVEGYPTVAVFNTTVGTVNPTVTVTNEAGTSDPETISIEVVDVDETQTPSIPSQNIQLFTTSLNNTTGGVISVFEVANLTTTVSLSGQDANRFNKTQDGNTVTISLVSPLGVGSYVANLSGENNDPDGNFSQTITSTFSVTVDIDTNSSLAFDFDPETIAIERIKTIESNTLNKEEYGIPFRFYVGFELEGTPSLIFKKPSGVTVEKTDTDGVIISNRDFTSGYGTLFEARKCLYYPIEQDFFDVKGQWEVRYKSNTGELGNWYSFQVVE